MAVMPDANELGNIALFKDLTPQELNWLNNHLHRQTYPTGSNIFMVDQPGEIVYIILEGTIKIYVDQIDGNEVILAILGPGDTVGELSLLDSAGRSANVVTLEKSTLLWMDRPTFWHCLQTMPSVTYKMVEVVCSRLRLANEQIKSLAALDIYGRVARQILAMAERYGTPLTDGDIIIPIRLTQSDIAGLIGATRERVNQVIVAYKREKYISVDRKYRVIVHNKDALAKRCL